MIRRTTFLLTAFLLMSSLATWANAQQTPSPALDSSAPVEISAAKSLEWDRAAKTYTARKDAHAQQGNLSVKSDTLTAHYDDTKGTTSITVLEAAGNVRISSAPYTAHGEMARYDVVTQQATLTGSDLRIETPNESLTAQDKITFDAVQNRLSAHGNALAKRGTDSLKSEQLNAFFAKNAQGKMTLQRITADQPVSIKTVRETITGNKGVYDVSVGKATLTGDVKIYQGENWIAGERAEVNLKTGISQLFAAPPAASAANSESADGRVRGVFYPKKQSAE